MSHTMTRLRALLMLTAVLAAAAFSQPTYRTFNQVDLASKKAKAGKVIEIRACLVFHDTSTGLTMTGLEAKLNTEIVSIDDSGGFAITLDHKGKNLLATGKSIAAGDSAVICATFRRKNDDLKVEWRWDTNGVKASPKYRIEHPPGVTLVQSEPNGGTVFEYLYKHVVPKPDGIIVGIRNEPDTAKVGWIRYKSPDRKFFPHTGPARCFDLITHGQGGTSPFDKPLKNPHVEKHNNNLLGEVHALKLAVLANDAGVTQPDTPATRLGDLIYDDAGNPSDPGNGKTIREILSFCDSALTYCTHFDSGSGIYAALDTTVTHINRGFDGPYTAVSFNPFEIAGTHTIAEVPFMHPNPAAAPRGLLPGRGSLADDQPEQYQLLQNYPNPFNPATTIVFDLPVASVVTLKVYNLLGQEVSVLLDRQEMEDGRQTVNFDAAALTSGVYFYRIAASPLGGGSGGFNAVRRMMVVK